MCTLSLRIKLGIRDERARCSEWVQDLSADTLLKLNRDTGIDRNSAERLAIVVNLERRAPVARQPLAGVLMEKQLVDPPTS
jgi:hypothetical protein